MICYKVAIVGSLGRHSKVPLPAKIHLSLHLGDFFIECDLGIQELAFHCGSQRAWLPRSPHLGIRSRGPSTWQWTLPARPVHPEMKEKHLGQFMGSMCPAVVSGRSGAAEAGMAAFCLESLCGLASWGPGFLPVSQACSLRLLEYVSPLSSNIFFSFSICFCCLQARTITDPYVLQGGRESSRLWSQTASLLTGKMLNFFNLQFPHL